MKKSIILLLIRIAAAILAYVSNFFITHIYNSKDAGYYFLFTTIIIVLSGVTKLGMEFQSLKTISILNSQNDNYKIKSFVYDVIVLLLLSNFVAIVPLIFIVYFTIHNVIAV